MGAPATRLVLDDEAACLACPRIGAVDPPPRERIIRTSRWTVAHAFNANLEGWLVVLPLRHVVTVDALDDVEADELGPLLRGCSAALRAVLGCEKTYVLQLAESVGFNHVHFHVVPRGADLPEAYRGPSIFGLLGSASLDVVEPARMDEIALGVRGHLVEAGFAASP
ncbi:MAG TPA: HIT domain-containing protein [Acidimicrobiales bacterium]|jgi:diadenosine tetraphosphate (Ap4A) HIT family hydrolase|nr:HIT domain-containing protein [Acidimicrobiales bacterium]